MTRLTTEDVRASLREVGECRRSTGLQDYRGMLVRHYRRQRIRQRFVWGILIACMVAPVIFTRGVEPAGR